MTPIRTLSDKQISLIADQINKRNLRKIAIQYFDFSNHDLDHIYAHNLWNLTNCRIIETWKDENPAEHHAAVSIMIFKNTGFQFLLLTLCLE